MVSPVQYCSYDGGLWVRTFGYGLSIRDTRKHGLVFSERNGYWKIVMIGKFAVKWLPRDHAG